MVKAGLRACGEPGEAMRTEEKAGTEGKMTGYGPWESSLGDWLKEKCFPLKSRRPRKAVHNCSPSTSGSRGRRTESLRLARDFTAIPCPQIKMAKEVLLCEMPLPTTQGALGPTSKGREGGGRGGEDSTEERREEWVRGGTDGTAFSPS